jgi:cytochrome b561
MSGLEPTINRYNGLARFFHWSMALLVMGLVAMGFYMVTLTYYDPWYQSAPNLHRSLGVLAFFMVVIRWGWRKIKPPPPLSPELKPLEKLAAHWVHHLLYGLMFVLPLSGYFITTAKGEPIVVFGLFEIPSLLTAITNQPIANFEDMAGFIHLALAIILVGLIFVHAAGGLKHHFIDKGDSLSRML